MQKVHDQYRDSRTWMNHEIRRRYDDLQGDRREFLKDRFNVHFSKQWASKAFSMHLVRLGTAGNIGMLIFEFDDFNESKEHRDIQIARGKMSEEELTLKCKRDQPRPWRH